MSLDYDNHNPEFEKAMNLVASTNSNLFLTGEAGTGKTHFLTSASERIKKPHVVLAPTGVAAQHAGGVTIHSFFFLGIGPYKKDFPVPKYNELKKEQLKKIELIFIDEVSMVRADMLDWIDTILQSVNGNELPFGGVQIVLVGDPFQLPPIVSREERLLLSDYESPFFFSSKVYLKARFSHIELKKAYRQTEGEFLSILNRMRNREADLNDLSKLNERVIKKGEVLDLERSIYLATHTARAKTTNTYMLNKLEGPIQVYDWIIDGIPSGHISAVKRLELAVGAKVMINRTFHTIGAKLYNGQIGRVTEVKENSVAIRIDNKQHLVNRVDWEVYKYNYDSITQKFERVVESRVSQFPLMLAWAITIHKSQGLSFDSVIADVNHSFSEGQVYVALSRCKSLEGIKLIQPVDEKSIKVNPKVVDFMNKSNPSELVDLRILLNSNRR